MLEAGDFFVGPYPPGSGKERRFVIVTDEVAGECTVVWVYASTSMSDLTVVLRPGIHPAITKECCVVYEEAAIVVAADIVRAVDMRVLVRQSRLDAGTIRLIQDGIFESDETPARVVRYCTDRI